MLLYTFYPTIEKCYKNVTGAYTVSIAQWTLQRSVGVCKGVCTDVARAFPGGQVAHPENRNEEESKQSLRKNKKNWSKFEERNEEIGILIAHPGLWGWLRPWVCVVRSTHFMGAFGEVKGVFGWEVYIQAKIGLSVSIF